MCFLATTAIERFWNKDKPLLFLHEGCCRFKKKIKDPLILPDIWDGLTRKEVEIKIDEMKGTYERVLKEVAEVLNHLHKRSYTQRYWRLVIGYWLYQYVYVMYDRYLLIEKAFAFSSDLDTIVMAEDSFYVPQNTGEFYLRYAGSDAYNLQLYSQIFSVLGMNFPKKRMFFRATTEAEKTVVMEGNEEVTGFSGVPSEAVVLHRSYFSRIAELMLLNNGQFPVINTLGSLPVPGFEINYGLRDQLHIVASAKNQFEQLIFDTVFKNIPRIYVEGYHYMQSMLMTHELYKTIPRVIFSATSLDVDEMFKQWAAICTENGTKFIAAAHSSSWPMFWIPWEDYSYSVSDVYCSANFRYSRGEKACVMPVPKFCTRQELKVVQDEDEILLLTTNKERYGSALFNAGKSMERYFTFQQLFFEALSKGNQRKLKVRLYRYDYEQDCALRWKSFAPNVELEDWTVPLTSRIAASRLIVLDNLQTVFWEVMIANRPVILFFDYEYLRPFYDETAASLLDELRDCGILYSDPVRAAESVNRIYHNVDVWWRDPARQAVRKKACAAFLGEQDGSIALWTKKIAEIAGLTSDNSLEDLDSYLRMLAGRKIVFIGVSGFTQYFIETFRQGHSYQVLGIATTHEDFVGKNLVGVPIDTFANIMKTKPDCVVITDFDHAHQIEAELIKVLPHCVKIINLLRELPEQILLDLMQKVVGRDIVNII